MSKKIFSFSFLLLLLLPFILIAQTAPEDFLGHRVGADRKLADYNQIQAYFHKLDKESGKIKVLTIGQSTLNKPIIMAVITSEDNMAKLDTYRGISKKLRDARGLTPDEARRLAREGKVIVFITCNLHADEIGSSQMAMEFAYNLVTGKTPFDADKILKGVIVLIAPTISPDGQQMVTDWYRKYVGTRYEGGRMPWLYQKYAGHDNNRDWFMLNLAETKVVTKVMYHDWIPQIHIDQHQIGPTGARLWIPPFANPPNPNVHPLIWRGVALCGMNMAYDLQKNGFKGVQYGQEFAGWWDGACDNTPWFHNTICLLSEAAEARVASPINIDPAEISKSYIEKSMQFPDPWPGGWWRLRDIVEYELTLSLSLVKTAFLHKEEFLYDFYRMCKDSIEKRGEGQPYAFVIPKKQGDYPTTLKMLDVLMSAGVEISQVKEDFVISDKLYPAGSFVILMSQPYRPYVQALLEIQDHPDLKRQYPNGPFIPLAYDNAGWTLPLQMGVKCDQINNPFKVRLTKLDKVPYPSPAPPQETASYLVLDSRLNNSYSVVFSLIKAKAEIYRSKDIVKGKGFEAAAGSFIVKNTPQVRTALPALLDKWHVRAFGLENIANVPKAPLKRFRIGLYQSWRPNMDEGWTRYVFDDLSIPFTTLHNKDFKGTKKKKVNLRARFDVIVFADENANIIKTGRPSPSSRYARYYSGSVPEYQGGIEKEGVEALKSFVEQGGILITLNRACGLAFDDFRVPAGNALERVDRSKFSCPGSILRVKVDNKSPIGYGMPKEAAIMFYRGMALSTRPPSAGWDRKVVARFPEDDILLSGWLFGKDVIARKAAVVDAKYKKGHIILIGFPCQHRAQSHGTYKFLLNALLYPEVK
jgi:hypothetical protein